MPSSLPVKFGVVPVEIIGCGSVCGGGVGNGLMCLLFLSVILLVVLHLMQYCLFEISSTISPNLDH